MDYVLRMNKCICFIISNEINSFIDLCYNNTFMCVLSNQIKSTVLK